LDFSEYYLANSLTPQHDFDQGKMFNEIPTYTKVNAIPYGYLGPLLTLSPWSTAHLSDVIATANLLPGNPDPPLSALTTPDVNNHTVATQLNVQQGDHVRFFVQNTGDKDVAFHIVGEQLDRVAVGNNIMAKGIQTWGIPAYADATIDVIFEQPGVYAIVNHDYSMLFKGQGSIVVVWPTGQTPMPNPSNAVPPQARIHHTSISQDTCAYGVGPNQQYDGNTGDDNQFISKCAIGLPSEE
jgi:nitrite reductase (NO-forming)